VIGLLGLIALLGAGAPTAVTVAGAGGETSIPVGRDPFGAPVLSAPRLAAALGGSLTLAAILWSWLLLYIERQQLFHRRRQGSPPTEHIARGGFLFATMAALTCTGPLLRPTALAGHTIEFGRLLIGLLLIPLDEFRIHFSAIDPIGHRTIDLALSLRGRRSHAELLRVFLDLICLDHLSARRQQFFHSNVDVMDEPNGPLRCRRSCKEGLTELPQQ